MIHELPDEVLSKIEDRARVPITSVTFQFVHHPRKGRVLIAGERFSGVVAIKMEVSPCHTWVELSPNLKYRSRLDADERQLLVDAARRAFEEAFELCRADLSRRLLAGDRPPRIEEALQWSTDEALSPHDFAVCRWFTLWPGELLRDVCGQAARRLVANVANAEKTGLTQFVKMGGSFIISLRWLPSLRHTSRALRERLLPQ